MANFITNVQFFGDGTDMPHIVSVRPILNAGRPADLDAIFNALAPTIIDRGKFYFKILLIKI